MGGILANNSSGMCCGVVAEQLPHAGLDRCSCSPTARSWTPSRPGADDAPAPRPARPARRRSSRCATRCARTPPWPRASAAEFARKNTTGYSLNAFLDHDAPAEILAHLMVGSQGTLGFLAEMTLRTVPEPPARATALLLLRRPARGGRGGGAAGRRGRRRPRDHGRGLAALAGRRPRRTRSRSRTRTAALLVEFREADAARAGGRRWRARRRALARRAAARPGRVHHRRAPSATQHWRLRKGLFPLGGRHAPVAAPRSSSRTWWCPCARLAEAIADLRALFERHGFPDAIVFGHARDGNLHFVFAQDFADPQTVRRYARLHARAWSTSWWGSTTARSRPSTAPAATWRPSCATSGATAAYGVMRRVKRLLDPARDPEPGRGAERRSRDPPQAPEAAAPHLARWPTAASSAASASRAARRATSPSPRGSASSCTARWCGWPPWTRREAREWRGVAASRTSTTRASRPAPATPCARPSCPVKIDTGALMKETARGRALRPLAQRVAGAAGPALRRWPRGARSALRVAALVRRHRRRPRLLERRHRPLHRALPVARPAAARRT